MKKTIAILFGIALVYSCTSQKNEKLPILITTDATLTIGGNASSGGNITDIGSSSITAKGVVWGVSTSPTISLTTKTVDGTGNGVFTSAITGLVSGTTYFARAYATNSAGTSYGNEITFTEIGVPSGVPLNGLVGYWPFNGNANDVSGNNINGVVYGATLTTDRNGNSNSAYLFNQNYINIPHKNALDVNEYSISLWISSSQNLKATLIKQNIYSNANNERFVIAINDPSSSILFATKYNTPSCLPGVGWQRNTSTQSVFDSKFHHIVGAVSGNSTKLYVDGILVNTLITAYNQNSQCYGGDLQIGRDWVTDPLYFQGKLDDIGIWNRALTQSEITALYNSTGK